MSNLKLIILAALLAVCLCDPVKENCVRPYRFTSSEDVTKFVKCLKTVTGSIPYGKRSIAENPVGVFFQKLHPKLVSNNDPEILEEMLFQVLKAERELRGT